VPFRIRKAFRLGPFLRLNLSRSGLSWSVGPRGLSWNSRRRTVRADLPGPLSWESRPLGRNSSFARRPRPQGRPPDRAGRRRHAGALPPLRRRP
jgi:hypothetical protein